MTAARGPIVLGILGTASVFAAQGCGGVAPAPRVAPSSGAGPSVLGAEPWASSGSLPRRFPAVVLDPAPAIPPAEPFAQGRGVVALREPPGGDAVRQVVVSLLEVSRRGSRDELAALLTSDARLLEGRARGREALIESIRARLCKRMAREPAGGRLLNPDRIERWDWDDLDDSDAPPRPAGMRAGEIYVRVPLEGADAAGDPPSGELLILVLRRERDGLKIAAFGEGSDIDPSGN